MSAADNVQIRSPLGKVVLIGVACVVFVVLGLVLIIVGSVGAKFSGVLCVAFFGGGGAWALRRNVRAERLIMTLTPYGLEAQEDRIPWSEITSVGPTVLGLSRPGGRWRSGTMGSAGALGIRLRDLGRYVASLPDSRVDHLLQSSKAATMLLGAPPPQAVGLDPRSQLVAQLRSLREANGGYDLTWAAAVLPGSPEKVAQRIRAYAAGRLGRP